MFVKLLYPIFFSSSSNLFMYLQDLMSTIMIVSKINNILNNMQAKKIIVMRWQTTGKNEGPTNMHTQFIMYRIGMINLNLKTPSKSRISILFLIQLNYMNFNFHLLLYFIFKPINYYANLKIYSFDVSFLLIFTVKILLFIYLLNDAYDYSLLSNY